MRRLPAETEAMPQGAESDDAPPLPWFTPDPPPSREFLADQQRREGLRWMAARLFVYGCGAGFLGAVVMCTEAGRAGFFGMLSLWCLAGAQYLRSRRDAVPKGPPTR